MKKFSGLFLLFLVLGLLMASSVLAVNPIDSLGDTLSKWIGKIGSLSFLGGNEDQLIGFLRILYGILVFTLMYLAFHAISDKIPKNIAITISIILAIMVAIFTPGTVLITFAGSYSVAAATILLGGLFGAAIWFVIGTKTETPFALGVKLFLLVLATWLIAQFDTLMVESKLITLGPGTTMFVGAVDFISDWAYLVFFLLIVWVIVAFLRSRKGGEWGTGSGVSDATGSLKKGLSNAWNRKKTRKKVRQKAEKAEEWEMLEFTDLEKIQKDLKNAKTQDDLKELFSDEKVAERHEVKANRRIKQAIDLVNSANLSPEDKANADDILKEMDVDNKLLIKALSDFKGALKLISQSKLGFNQAEVNRAKLTLTTAINANKGVVASFEKLKKLFKE